MSMLKNNNLTIALVALLVGGVATAGYMNSRSNKSETPQPQPVAAAPADAALTAPAVTGMPGNTMDPMANAAPNLAPSPGALTYADVINVAPVTEREPLYATVIGSEPIRETSTTRTPQEVCENVTVQERLPERDGNVGGTVAGALIGGLVGNQVGKGNGRKAATAAGAVAGGFIGNRVDRNHVGGKVVDRTERQCHTVNRTSSSAHTVAWKVTYRTPDGNTNSMRTEHKPGSKIALGDTSKTVGYDVTYRLDGAEHTVRMAQEPGTQLPVINGQVVTQTASVDGDPMR